MVNFHGQAVSAYFLQFKAEVQNFPTDEQTYTRM